MNKIFIIEPKFQIKFSRAKTNSILLTEYGHDLVIYHLPFFTVWITQAGTLAQYLRLYINNPDKEWVSSIRLLRKKIYARQYNEVTKVRQSYASRMTEYYQENTQLKKEVQDLKTALRLIITNSKTGGDVCDE